MTSPQPQTPNTQEISDVLKRVNDLGSNTEKLFSRLYTGLNKRTHMSEAQYPLALTPDQAIQQEMRRKDAEINRLYRIVASVDEGILMLDIEGVIVMINQAAQNMLDDDQANFWETGLGDLFTRYQSVEQIDGELELIGEQDGIELFERTIHAQVAGIGDETGRRIGTLMILRDVTQASRSERMKKGFVTHISHELKTPMTVIKMAGEVLSGQKADEPVNERILDTLTRNVDILDRMVIELLDISELDSGEFDIERKPVNLETLIWRTANEYSETIQKAKLDLMVMTRDVDRLMVTGDEARLKWALGHLLRNSINYTERNGRIVMSAGVVTIDGVEQIVVRVRDNGVGIGEKDIPHIFDRFYRGEPRTEAGKLLDPRGLGQGLYIAQTITEMHGGYISVRTTAHVGSEFTMHLPLPVALPTS